MVGAASDICQSPYIIAIDSRCNLDVITQPEFPMMVFRLRDRTKWLVGGSAVASAISLTIQKRFPLTLLV